MLSFLKKFIPKSVFNFFQPAYHYLLALTGAVLYRFPSRQLTVIGVTGTKGKSTTTELLNSVLEAAGYKTALQSTIHFKIAEKDERNLYKMSMPGRFFMQKFLRDAVGAGCTHAVLELTSEGAKQYRHKFIALDALIFTNLAPEHIESHGSYEKYVEAKLSIARELEHSPKPNPCIVVNADDKEAEKFLALEIKNKVPYSLSDAHNIESDEAGNSFQASKLSIHSALPGRFNLYNMLGVIACARFLGISEDAIKNGLEKVDKVRGRAEKIENDLGIEIVVDYAHTPDSLKALYETFCSPSTSGPRRKLVCVLGNTGGGRDRWKRRVMAEIADQYCEEIILANEDPYDEDPRAIVEEMREGVKTKPVEIILDRRAAIAAAIKKAGPGDAVLITGKGTDPYIMLANGEKMPWDDASVVREELRRIMNYEL